jgi:RNA polymerase sigma factor (TIGR02999 family)
MNDVTQILGRLESGDSTAAEHLLPLVYEELRRLAAQKMAQEKTDQTLQATGLVHEAYLRLVGSSARQNWNSRGHFFKAAAEAMRRILIESSRRKVALKRGGAMGRVDLADVDVCIADSSDWVIALDAALARFAEFDPAKAELVKLRYFAGLTIEEAAAALDVSIATANRYWTYARAWLQSEMASGDELSTR